MSKLTMSDATHLQTILEAVQGNKRVRWAVDGDLGAITDGVARAITHEDSTFLHADEDVRDGFVWISGMLEHFLPVRQVMAQVSEGTFVIEDDHD